MVTEKLKEKVECIFELAKQKGCKITAEDMLTMIQTNMTVPCHTDDFEKFTHSELQWTYVERCNKITLYDVELLYKWQMDYALAEIPAPIKDKVIKAISENNMEELYNIALKDLGLGVAVAIKNIVNKQKKKTLLTAEDIRKMSNKVL